MVQKHNLILSAFGANLKWWSGMLMISIEESAYISNREGDIDNSANCSRAIGHREAINNFSVTASAI